MRKSFIATAPLVLAIALVGCEPYEGPRGAGSSASGTEGTDEGSDSEDARPSADTEAARDSVD